MLSSDKKFFFESAKVYRLRVNPCIFILKYMDENIVNTKQDGTDRLALGRWRPWISMGRPVLPGPKLEQLPGLVKPASFARLSRAGGS